MEDKKNKFNEFLGIEDNEITKKNEQQIKVKDGLIEKVVIDKKYVTTDGRELLKEERPISHSNKMIN